MVAPKLVIDGIEGAVFSMTPEEYKSAPRSAEQEMFPKAWDELISKHLAAACDRKSYESWVTPGALWFSMVQALLLASITGRTLIVRAAFILYFMFLTSEVVREDKAEDIGPLVDLQSLLVVGASCLVMRVLHKEQRHTVLPRVAVALAVAASVADKYVELGEHVLLAVHGICGLLLGTSVALGKRVPGVREG